MKKLIVICCLFCASNSFAFDEWTNTNTALQVTYSILHILDWGQTLHQAKQNWKYTKTISNSNGTTCTAYKIEESNFILGDHPSQTKVNLYFASTLLLHPVVSYALPKVWRESWQTAGIGLEIYVVGKNFTVGLNGLF